MVKSTSPKTGNLNFGPYFLLSRPNRPVFDITGAAVAVRVIVPAREKYRDSRKFTQSLSKYLNATYKLPKAADPIKGNFIAGKEKITIENLAKLSIEEYQTIDIFATNKSTL
jgi:hypothetical protein